MIDDSAPIATDVYLDSLLARRAAARPIDIPVAASLPPPIRMTADLLDRALPRFHPSFRFEERLAGRLRTEAAGRGAPQAPGELVTFPGMGSLSEANHDAVDRRARSLLVGGAIASGVSIAGAAFAGAKLLAWRRGRGPGGVAAGAAGERAI